jgi:hypothetical protein
MPVAVDLRSPPARMSLGPSPVFWTTVPETSVDENDDPGRDEGEVRAPPQAGKRPVHSETEAESVRERT